MNISRSSQIATQDITRTHQQNSESMLGIMRFCSRHHLKKVVANKIPTIVLYSGLKLMRGKRVMKSSDQGLLLLQVIIKHRLYCTE